MVQRGAIVKDGTATRPRVGRRPGRRFGDGGRRGEWTIVNMHKGHRAVVPQDTHLSTSMRTLPVVATSHGDGVDYDVGDWRDTITLPTPGNVTVRFPAADFDGPSLAHCPGLARGPGHAPRALFNPRRSRVPPPCLTDVLPCLCKMGDSTC